MDNNIHISTEQWEKYPDNQDYKLSFNIIHLLLSCEKIEKIA